MAPENSRVQPYYNFAGQPAKFCVTHKQPGMEDVKNATCADPSCNIQPSYNFDGQPAKFCVKHQQPGMINVRNATCADPSCDIRPYYNFGSCTIEEAEHMVDTAMNRNYDAMTEFCTVHGVVPAHNSFRYCPYEVVVAVFNKMVEMGMPEEMVIDAVGSRLWHSVTDYDVWKRGNLCAHP